MDSKPLKNVALSHASHSEVVFEDYLFYAALQRKEEEGSQEANSDKVIGDPQGLSSLSLDEQERMEATRALRIASWISILFLLTTDMTGPVTAPYAISQVGWVPGVILSVICCVCSLVVASPLIHHHPQLAYCRHTRGFYYGDCSFDSILSGTHLKHTPIWRNGSSGGLRDIFAIFCRRRNYLSVYILSAASMRDTMVDLIFPPQVGATCLALGQGLSQMVRGRVSIVIITTMMSYNLNLLVVFFGLHCHLYNNWYDHRTNQNAQGATLRISYITITQ